MMKWTMGVAVAMGLVIGAGSAEAASKKKECGYQRDIVAAVQKARLDRVPERKVTETVLAGEVTWPERYNDTIAIFASEIYKLKRRDLKTTDVGAQWEQVCLTN